MIIKMYHLPIPGKNMLTSKQNTAIPICMAGIAALQALLDFCCVTTTVVGGGCWYPPITTVVLFCAIAIVNITCVYNSRPMSLSDSNFE